VSFLARLFDSWKKWPYVKFTNTCQAMQDTPKFSQIGIFWLENIPSGYTAPQTLLPLFSALELRYVTVFAILQNSFQRSAKITELWLSRYIVER
jgi:hypothetical protein